MTTKLRYVINDDPKGFAILFGVFLVVFTGFCIELSRKLILAFALIKMAADKNSIDIVGGGLSKNLVWKEVDTVSVERVFYGRSLTYALVFRSFDGGDFQLLDQYTISSRDLFVILRTFCNEHGIHVTFNSGGRWR